MIRGAKDDCPEFDAAAFAREAERIAALGRHALPDEVGHRHGIFYRAGLRKCRYVLKMTSREVPPADLAMP